MIAGAWGRVRRSRTLSAMRSLATLATPPTFEADAPTAGGLAYTATAGRRGRAPLADVYLPDGAGPHPSVVVVHGGGFTVGSRRMKPVRYLATELRRAGVAVAAIDYRLVFRGGRLDEALDDVAAAVRWWAGQADALDLDPAAIQLCGFSAGGTLTLLSAPRTAPLLAGFVSIFGLYDFAAMGGGASQVLTRLVTRTGDRAVWRARSVLSAPPIDRPVLLLHGTGDTLVDVGQARALAAQRAAAGLPVRLLEYEGEEHAFLCDARRPAAQQAVADVLAAVRGGA